MITVLDVQRALARAAAVPSVRAFVDNVGCYDVDVVTAGELTLVHVCVASWLPFFRVARDRAGARVDDPAAADDAAAGNDGTLFIAGAGAILTAATSRLTVTISRCEFRGADSIDWTKPLGAHKPARRCRQPGVLIDERRSNGHTQRRAVCLEHGGDVAFAVREHPHANMTGWPDAV